MPAATIVAASMQQIALASHRACVIACSPPGRVEYPFILVHHGVKSTQLPASSGREPQLTRSAESAR
jgi:hypothetical protein